MKSLALLFCLIPAQAATVNIYSGVPGNAGGLSPGPLNFSGDTLAGSFFAPDINFGSLSTNWDPLGLTTNFGADITATINVASAGSYTFNTTSDDGSVLLIDGQEVVNNNANQGATQRIGSINLSAGLHIMEVQYYQGGGGNELQATLPAGVSYLYEQPTLAVYQDPGPLPGGSPVPPPLVESGATLVGGIPITSPNGVSFGLPNSNWSPFNLQTNFSAEMHAAFLIPTSGNYTFNTGSDDGSVLFIDGQMVVDNSYYQGYTIRQGTVFLTAGLHPFDLQYFQGGGGAALTMGVPAGVSIVPTPEPATWMLSAGVFAAALLQRSLNCRA